MHVRATTIIGDTTAEAKNIGSYKDMVSKAQKLDGFLGAILLLERQTGKGVGLTFWESEAAMTASEEAANKLRADGASTIGATTPPTVERFEVGFYAPPELSAVR